DVVLNLDKRVVPAGWLDRLGIAASAFCLVQCLALPLALIFAPLASSGLFSHEMFHLILLAVILPVSLPAFVLGFLRHRNARMWIPASLGLALLLLASVLEQRHALGAGSIALVTSSGGVLLILGHVLNLRSRGSAGA
ncbi:MAG: MerC domain-containing protein, partial [Wenzhouxiangellaceae bacterium]|nr:MerC domain-containing protein [Wenzhouxiangellaceae bacterium]